MMAGEILQLRSALEQKQGGKGAAVATTVVDSEQEMLLIQKVSDLTHEVKKLKKLHHQAKESADSLQENVDLYEEELKRKKKSWRDAIQKESKRRKKAENEVRRLKAKVEELEFLMDQRETSDELSSDEESGDETIESKSNDVRSRDQPSDTVGTKSVEGDSSSQSTSSGEGGEYNPSASGESSRDVKEVHPMVTVPEPILPASKAEESLPLDSAPTSQSENSEEASFEERLRKRIDQRQKIIDLRSKQLDLDVVKAGDNTGASLSSSAVVTKSSSLEPVATSQPLSEIQPLSEASKKVNIFDRIAAVFKQNPTS
jgi:hypothetical protein